MVLLSLLTACVSDAATPESVAVSPTAVPATVPATSATAVTVTTAPPTLQPTSTVGQISSSTPPPTIVILSYNPTAAPGQFTPVIAPTLTPARVLPPTVTVLVLPTAIAVVASPVPVNITGGPDAEEQAFLVQLNRYRQSNGRAPLAFEPLLLKSARWMAQDMAEKNYIGHTDSLNRNIPARIKAFGYSGNWPGENIAGGFEHAADNLAIWQSDDIHKNNLLGASYTKAGVGRYYKADSYNHWYWVLDLG